MSATSKSKTSNGKRRDASGRVLKTGESQRANGSYQYRYTVNGERFTVYAPTLQALRAKETEITVAQAEGIDYSKGRITVIQLMERCLSLKRGLRAATQEGYRYAQQKLQGTALGALPIRDAKPSHVQEWVLQRQEEGLSYSTLRELYCKLRVAFRMAHDEGVIRRSPMGADLNDIIQGTPHPRSALTREQYTSWLDFLASSPAYEELLDIHIVLLGTGLRVGEFCGLTKGDIDLGHRRLTVKRQLQYLPKEGYVITPPKTASGVRTIPLNPEVCGALTRILQRRDVPEERIVQGVTGFLVYSKQGAPIAREVIEKRTHRAFQKYCADPGRVYIPALSPHVLRHTFCTELIHQGVEIKVAQQVLGHSSADVTLNVYTHVTSYDQTEASMRQFTIQTPFTPIDTPIAR